MRYFLDPFDRYTDDEIIIALTKTNMIGVIKKLGGDYNHHNITDTSDDSDDTTDTNTKFLDFELDENGGNLSVGERQLLVLTKAILRGSKILIMDEVSLLLPSSSPSLLLLLLLGYSVN